MGLGGEPVDSCAGEGSLVHQGREDDFGREAGEGFSRCWKEEGRGAADATAEDNDVGLEGGGMLVEDESEMAAEDLEGAAGAAVG